jgi:hypothetical protein
MMDAERDKLLEPNGDGTFRLTAAGDRLLRRALLSSVKFVGYIQRKPGPPLEQHGEK